MTPKKQTKKEPTSILEDGPTFYRLSYENGGFAIYEAKRGAKEVRITEPEVWAIAVRQLEQIMRKSCGL